MLIFYFLMLMLILLVNYHSITSQIPMSLNFHSNPPVSSLNSSLKFISLLKIIQISTIILLIDYLNLKIQVHLTLIEKFLSLITLFVIIVKKYRSL